MKKKFLKALVIVGCAILLVIATITCTVAYLTSVKVVTNTFTVGNVTITLDETDVDLYGKKDGDARVTKNEYKLIPGHEYVKDPTVTVLANSENCYVFVKVDNGIAAIEAGDKIATQITTNGWTALDGNEGVYWCEYTSNPADEKIPVFGEFTIATNADVSTYESKKIVVTAYAVQKDGIDIVQAAWEAVEDIDPNNP